MTLHELQINRFEVEVETVLFLSFFLARFSVDKNMAEINLLALL